MAVLTKYKGLDVVEGASGDAGIALTNDFKELANRAPFTSTDDPTIDDDSGDGFSAGSSWLNTTDQTVFMCTDATVGSAVWKSVFKRDGSSLTLVPDDDGSVAIDNLQFDGNTISSTDTDGDILLAPDGSGKIGIGTTAPARLLELASAAPRVRLSDSSDGLPDQSTAVFEYYYTDTGGTPQLMGYLGFTSSSDANMEIRNALDGDLELWTNNVKRAVITSSGNFGVGTSSPDAKIDIDGEIAIKDGMTAPSATSGKAKLYVDSADGDLKVIFGDGTVKTLATDS